MRNFLLSSIALGALLLTACEPQLQPIGEPSTTVQQLEAAGWVSQDTFISVTPQTFEETLTASTSDRRPDTLADGTIVYQLSEYMPLWATCTDAEDAALCTQAAISEFVQSKLRYPTWARAQGITGTVVATFVIGADGNVRQPGIERSMGDRLDLLVLRMINQMPAWHPGFHGGEPVAVRWQLPVSLGSLDPEG